MAINRYQKKLLDEYLYFPFSSICDEDNLSAEEQFFALISLVSDTLFELIRNDLLIKKTILDEVEQIRKIFSHPCPQNRSTGDYMSVQQETENAVWLDHNELVPYIARFELVVENGVRRLKPIIKKKPTVKKEPYGLLCLTPKNNNQEEPVTKEDVVSYIKKMIIDKAELLLKNLLIYEGLPTFIKKIKQETEEETLTLCALFLYFKNEILALTSLISNLNDFEFNVGHLIKLALIKNNLESFITETNLQPPLDFNHIVNNGFQEFIFIMKHKDFFLPLIQEQGATLEGLCLLGLKKLYFLSSHKGQSQKVSMKLWKEKSISFDLTFGFLTTRDMGKLARGHGDLKAACTKVETLYDAFKKAIDTDRNDNNNNFGK